MKNQKAPANTLRGNKDTKHSKKGKATQNIVEQNSKTVQSTKIYEAAKSYIEAGLNVLPCERKAPAPKIKKVSKLRVNPISAKNVFFFFNDAEQIALLTGDRLECIDVDSKYDLTGKLKSRLLSAIKYALPDVYKKLVIESSINGGLHLIYKCNQIGGNQIFAKRPATAEDKKEGKRYRVLIETRGAGGLIVCHPSPGYDMVQGEITSIDCITIEERQELIAICRSFDLLVNVHLPGLSRRQKQLPDAPWNIFNKDHDYKWMAKRLQEADYTIVNEDDDKIYVLRPGSKAKTSGAIWKESNILYLFTGNTEFEAEKPLSAFSIYCTLGFDGDVKAAAKHLAEDGIGTWNAEDSEFYTITEKKKVEIRYSAIVEWMNDIGIRKYKYCPTDFEVVQVTDNIVQTITLDHIKKMFGTYIKETVPESVYNVFLANIRNLFTKDGLLSQIDELDNDSFIKSDAHTGWVFFKNGALRITDIDHELLCYGSFEGNVWERNIIKRDFLIGNDDGDIKEFIRLIAGERKEVEQMFICAIGYLLHNYKDPVNPKVVILNDEFYDENRTEPEGGTGKGLFIQLLKHFRNLYSVDGKSFKLDRPFPFQGISADTELFAIEDAARGFDFERMFSIVTDGMTIEKKGRDEFKIPYESSPKILITTNYAIKGTSSSHARRRYELEIASVFSNSYTPIDHFKHRFFDDWDESAWQSFYNYMVNCLQTFLREGLPAEVNINLKKKKLIQETNRDFINWIENLHKEEGELPKGKISKASFKDRFTTLYPDYAHKLTIAKFTQWLVRWGKDNGVVVDASNRIGNDMAYHFKGQIRLTKAYELSENEKLKDVGKKPEHAEYNNSFIDSLDPDEDIF